MTAPPGLTIALIWLLLLGWGFRVLLRRQLRYADRQAEVATQLELERRARVLAERALSDTHLALCKLAGQQEVVREAERKRIARDIHDDLGQNLLALKIELSMLQISTPSAHPMMKQKLDAMIGSLDLTIKSLRSIINDLRPLALEAGLQNAIEWQLGEFSRISGIAHQLEIEPGAAGPGMDKTVDTMLFRVLQESLANVVRHAQASEVRVVLRRCNGDLTLCVQDNGVGITGMRRGNGCGLAGIRDRAAAIGGTFAIDSQPGAGTRLLLSVPLPLPVGAH